MGKTIETDVAIVGAGPVGLFAAFECGMLKLNSVLIDALAEIGGQCTALYPEKYIFDVAGYPKVLAKDLVRSLTEQAAQFHREHGVPAYLGQRVVGLNEADGSFVLETETDSFPSKSVVIAAGIGAFALLVCGLVGWLLIGRTFRPLTRIEDTAAGIAAGDLTRRVDVPDTDDEVASLSRSLNAMLARIERLRLRLAEEGLFDAARKQRLPLLPAVIGVVTSAQGAVLQDIRTTVARRFARPILLWPVPVQGPDAAARIAAAIAGFDAMQPGGAIPRPDVLIVARGGGSLEDLMAFNDEAVVRAAAASAIPLISAVGHETDHTLIDFASDRRAPTPTAAAELAVPSRIELVATVGGEAARLNAGLNRMVGERRLRLSRAERGLPDLAGLVGTVRQRLDDRSQRLRMALPNLLAARRAALGRADRMPDLPALVRAARLAVDGRAQRLRLALPNLVGVKRATLARAGALPDPRGLVAHPGRVHPDRREIPGDDDGGEHRQHRKSRASRLPRPSAAGRPRGREGGNGGFSHRWPHAPPAGPRARGATVRRRSCCRGSPTAVRAAAGFRSRR